MSRSTVTSVLYKRKTRARSRTDKTWKWSHEEQAAWEIVFYDAHTHTQVWPRTAVPLKSGNRRLGFNCPEISDGECAAISRWEREMINSGLIAGAEWSCHLAQQRAKSASHHLFAPLWIICKIFLCTVLCASLDSFGWAHTTLAALEMMMLEVLELVWALV
jgi:hypothetical protein